VHRDLVFNLAHGALAKAKVKPPRTFKEAKIADEMARKACGFDDRTEDVSKENFWVSDDGLQWIIISAMEGEKLWITFITPKDSPAQVRAMGPTFQLKVPLVKH